MKYLITICLAIIFFMNGCARRTVVVTNSPYTTTVVKSLPTNHRIVHVKGVKYYYFNGRHYKRTPRGYVLVRV
jgi:hypothetical protein